MTENVYMTSQYAISKEVCQRNVLAHLSSTSIALRSHLTIAGLIWEEIRGCYPWLQVELTSEEFIAILLKYEINDADLLD